MRDRQARPGRVGTAVTALTLAVAFLLGAALVFMGSRGRTAFTDSGFSDGSGFDAVYNLSVAADGAWKDAILPDLRTLDAEEREAVGAIAAELAANAWEAKSAGGAGQVQALLADTAVQAREELAFKLLCAADFLNENPGKVAKTKRDPIAALAAEQKPPFRQAVLRSLTHADAELPGPAADAVGSKTGADRQAVLMQCVFISCGLQDEAAGAAATALKQGVRDPAMQLTAFRMIARGEISWLWTLIVHNAGTAILLGIVLMTDVVLLMLLMAREHRWRLNVKWIMILLIVDFLLYFLLMPMVYMLIQAFTADGHFTLERLSRLYRNPDNLAALKTTLIAAAATMVLGPLIAFPLAWLVGRTNLIGKRFFRFLFILTYMVPPYVGAMAWTHLMNPNAGPVNQVLRAIFGMGDSPGPLNIYSLPGLIWVLTTFYYPYAFITISRAMEKMDPTLEEASRIAGASPFRTMMKITLPMMTPSLIAGALLVFVSAASCYGIPSIIAGGTSGLETATTRIKLIQGLGQDGITDATGLAVFLMLVALLILFLSDVVLARKQYTTVSGKSTQPVIVDLRRWRVPLTVLTWLFALVVVFLPFLTILSISLRTDLGKSVLDISNLTLSSYVTAFREPATLACLKNSLIFALIAATAGIAVSCVMSYLLQRTQIRGRSIPNFLITLGSGTPSVVIAVGLIMTMKGNLGLNIVATPMIMVVAYLVKYLMMGMRTVVSAMSQIHVSLEESSQISGAGWTRTMLRITAPLILPSIIAGWLLIFIPCFYELSMSVLLSTDTTKTIGVQLFDYWTFHSKQVGCAMAFGILLVVVALNLLLVLLDHLLNRLTRGKSAV